MDQRIKLVRSVSSEFIRRKLRSVVMVVSVILIITFLLLAFLTRYSAWIWIPTILVVLALLVVIGTYLLASFAVRILRPAINAQQGLAVSAFVDKVERVTDYAETPKVLVLFYVLRDLIRPSDEPFLRKVAKGGTSLHRDFIQLAKDFETNA